MTELSDNQEDVHRLTSLLCLHTLDSQSYLSSSTTSIFAWSCLHRFWEEKKKHILNTYTVHIFPDVGWWVGAGSFVVHEPYLQIIQWHSRQLQRRQLLSEIAHFLLLPILLLPLQILTGSCEEKHLIGKKKTDTNQYKACIQGLNWLHINIGK